MSLWWVLEESSMSSEYGGRILNRWGSEGSLDGQFKRPYGIAVDGAGNVYVADAHNHRVQVFNINGQFLRKWSSEGTADGQFKIPQGIAVDGAGNVYVADTHNHRVQVFDHAGGFLTKWGSLGDGNGQFVFPVGMAVDSPGNVYIADRGNHRVQVFNVNGQFLRKWGSQGTADGQFKNPQGIAVDGAGNVYVADTGNHRVQVFNHTGEFLTKWAEGSQGFLPVGIAVDSAKNVYVLNQYALLQVYNHTGEFLTEWIFPDSPGGQESGGIAVDRAGNVYVADTGNHQVQAYKVRYTVTATAGTGGAISPSGEVPIEHGTDQTFAITPHTGYRITDVMVDDASVGPMSSYTFANVTEHHTIEAQLSPDEVEEENRMIEMIVDTNTPIPSGSGTFDAIREHIALDGESVAFVGTGPSQQKGIYLVSGNSLSVVADMNTAIPDGTGNFTNFDHRICLDGNDVAFTGFGSSGQKGIYLASDGSLSKVADFNTPVPGGSSNFRNFHVTLSLERGVVAFVGWGSSGEIGVYLFRVGLLTVVADTNTPVPGGSGNFITFRDPSLSGTDAAFVGLDSFQQEGIYISRDGVITVLADANIPIPGGSGNFLHFFATTLDGSEMAFRGEDSSRRGGIYLASGGSVTLVADTNTPVPEGMGNFTNVGGFSLDNGNVAFGGFGSSGQEGIYLSRRGSLQKIIDLNDPLENKDTMVLAHGKVGLSGDAIAFRVMFTSQWHGIYRHKIGTEQVPILNLTIGVEGQGTTDPKLGVYRYEEGTQVAITASPDPGCRFDHWYGAASGDSPTVTITMSGHTIVTAHFEKIPIVAPLYIANSKSMEIHKSDCFWVTQMNNANKLPCSSLEEVAELIRDTGYNGCFYCLPRYDGDTLTAQQVLLNLEEDLVGATTEPSPPPEEVIVDFTSVGRGVPFAHDHFESVGIVFTKSSEFSGFVQWDEALISSGGQIAADIPQGYSDISVLVAASLQGLWEFTLTAFDNSGEAINQTSLSLEDTGSAGYQVLSLSDLSGAVSFELSGTKDRESGEFGVSLIRFTPAPESDLPSPSIAALPTILFDSGGLAQINPDGTGLTSLAPGAINGSWSPDLTKIAYTAAIAPPPSRNREIFTINADGTDKRQITVDQHVTYSTQGEHLAWSPDGTRIAATRNTGGYTEIVVVTVATGRVQVLANSGTFPDSPLPSDVTNPVDPDWSPDGTKVLFIAHTPGGWEFWTIDPSACEDSTATAPCGTNAVPVSPHLGYGFSPHARWKPNGTKIIYCNGNYNGQVILANPDAVSPNPIVLATGSFPTWWPDGTKFAYNFWDGDQYTIRTANADGSNSAQVPNAAGVVFAWSSH